MIRKLIYDVMSKAPDINIDDNSELKEYYFRFIQNPKKLNKLISTFDKNGIPLNSAYIDVENPKLHYYPISIGQYGLSIFHTYIKSKSDKDKDHFLRVAEWFVGNVTLDERLGAYWLTEVDKPEFNVYQPWKSAFTQSRALSVLLRAWQLTGDDKYKNLANKALIPYQYNVKNGGVKSGDKSDVIFEEYVADRPTRILDGAIFSLFGLRDAMRAFRGLDEIAYHIAKTLFDQGIAGLTHWLPNYDMGYWVYYNRCEIEGYPSNDPCTIGYLKLVTAQLKILHALTGKEIFAQYVNLFSSYLKPINIFKMYVEKYKALKTLNRL